MAGARIAVLFDAENTSCETAGKVLQQLRKKGDVSIRRAVGDFSLAALENWMDCARQHGIELVLQPSLGKGKNSADIRLTVEAMDIVHKGMVDTVALVTQDRDFAPLAIHLRGAGLNVLGFSHSAPSPAFSAACSAFEVIGDSKRVAPTNLGLTSGEVSDLRAMAKRACEHKPISPGELGAIIQSEDPQLKAKLGGAGKFLKTLVASRIVIRVGQGPGLLVRAA